MTPSLEQITDAWPHGMIVLDHDRRVVRWNQWMERASGVAVDAAIGQTLETLFAGEEVSERLLRAVVCAVEDGTSAILTRTFTPHPLPLRRGPKEDKFMHLSIRVRSIRTETGERACLLDIHDESSSARRDEKMLAIRSKLEQQAVKLQEAHEALDFFVRHAAHDLRAPLRGVTTFAGFLREDLGEPLSEEVERDLDHIETSVQSMTSILDDLLSLSQSTTLALEARSVSLEDCVDSALYALKDAIAENGASIERGVWPEVVGNELLLTQLIQNLLLNALQHSVEGGVSPKIRLTLEEAEGEALFGIRDAGPGLPEGKETEIWAPFKSLGEAHAGTGLGLAICRKIVERHHGRIWCESCSGEGAHFRFTLNSF